MRRAVGSVMGFGQILTAGLFAWGASGDSFAQSACQVAHMTASDGGPFDRFGYAVAVTGDTAIIGANWDDDNGFDSGSAYVFRFDGTSWLERQKLLASDGESDDEFGRALSADGNVALVGAPWHSHVGIGAVYVFNYDGSAWVQSQELTASGAGFGKAVSIWGDVALIGAPNDGSNGPQSGSAYVFRFDAETSQWVQEQKLLASNGSSGDFFGEAVAIFGDVAVIGASGYFEILPEGFLGGAAYVFRFDPDTSQWVEEQQLLPFQTIGDTGFGAAVSISGNLILIGARFDSSAFAVQFDPLGQPGSRWVGKQRVVPSDGNLSDQFGVSVAMDGDTALVGAFVSDLAGLDQGAAYTFRFEGSTWVEQQTLLPEVGPWTPFFGRSVAIAGDTAVVGAHGEDVGSGGAYLYAECFCPWDCDGNNDGIVSVTDLLALLGQYDPLSPNNCTGGSCDFDNSGCVDVVDLLKLLAHYDPAGVGCP